MTEKLYMILNVTVCIRLEYITVLHISQSLAQSAQPAVTIFHIRHLVEVKSPFSFPLCNLSTANQPCAALFHSHLNANYTTAPLLELTADVLHVVISCSISK